MKHPKVPPNCPLFTEVRRGKWLFEIDFAMGNFNRIGVHLETLEVEFADCLQTPIKWLRTPMNRAIRLIVASTASAAWLKEGCRIDNVGAKDRFKSNVCVNHAREWMRWGEKKCAI